MPAIGGCVIIKDEKLLLLWRNAANHYELPGGKIELKETVEETVIREAQEELGVEVRPVHYLGYTDFFHENREFRSYKVLCEIVSGKPRIAEPHLFNSLEWIALNQIKKKECAPNVLQLCEQFEHGEFNVLFAAPKGITTLVDKRPWGMFEQFVCSNAAKPCAVKLLTIKPNSMLSLQYHHNRDEFWRVLSGTGLAEVNNERFELKPDADLFIKRGIKHRPSAGKDGLKILELAFGRFDESDIVRLEDEYGRV